MTVANDIGTPPKVCPSCGSEELSLLPAPHPSRAMASDGRVIHHPLLRASCNSCGYGFRTTMVPADEPDSLYDQSYGLSLQDVAADEQRAKAYAALIAKAVSRHLGARPRPIRLVEFGSGTGALLAALGEHFAVGKWLGIEPAEQLVAAARERVGPAIAIAKGYAETVPIAPHAFDVCVSVNVIEHSMNPLRFLAACKNAVAPGGVVVVVCPDGNLAGTELLFSDHVSDFSLDALSGFAGRAGLRPIESYPLEGAQSGFRLSVFEAQDATEQAGSIGQWQSLVASRHRYLAGWRELGEVSARMPDGRPFVVFGVGEFYDLLRAYAPDLIALAKGLVVDSPTAASKDGRPVMSTAAFLEGKEVAGVLAAVNPMSWAALRGRFTDLGVSVWHPFELCSLRTELH